MSLYKDASLVMIPSAYKDGKLYSIRPTDGSGDFTFSRGSNLAATRVDVNGLIEKGRENLIKQSNNFDTTPWGAVSASVTPNATTAPDGTLTASKIVATSVNGQHRIDQTTTSSSGLKTFSVYVKQSEITTTWLRIGSTGCFIDLTNGAISSISSGIIPSVVALSNDWYRCSITKTNATANEIVRINAGNSDYLGDDVSGIFLWRAQYEEGLVATDYIETGASTAQAGILEDMPRLDYSGSCPSLLLEPQRTNLEPYSEYFNAWNAVGGEVLTPNSILSPEGVLNGYTLAANNSGSALNIYDSIVVTSGADYVFSVWLKKNNTNNIEIYMYSTQAPLGFVSRAEVDFDAGTITDLDGSGATIEPYDNGWFRCSIKCTAPSTSLSNGIYNTDGGADVYAYGAQLEAGSYPTSYIPTYGTSQTRSAENNVLGTPISLDSNFCLFWEGAVLEDDIMLYGSGTNAWYINYTTSSGRIILDETSGRKVMAYLGSGSSTGVRAKIMVRRESGVHSIFANGAKLTNVTSVDSNSTLSLSSMYWGFNSSFYKGLEVNQSLVFETALTDSECIALTTL